MSRDEWNNKVEGYWASYFDSPAAHPELVEGYQSHFPWPKANEKQWSGQELFLTRLAAIEQVLARMSGYRPDVDVSGVIYYRGLSFSRLENGKHVGNKEYVHVDKETEQQIRWPEALRWHYICGHNVMPSKEFYDFVMNHPLAVGIKESSCVMCKKIEGPF
jgi:hypothetical protein